MDLVFIKPADGARIRQPERNSRVMPEAGDRVVRDLYYERLIITGDVVVVPDEPPPAAREKSARAQHEPARGARAVPPVDTDRQL